MLFTHNNIGLGLIWKNLYDNVPPIKLHIFALFLQWRGLSNIHPKPNPRNIALNPKPENILLSNLLS